VRRLRVPDYVVGAFGFLLLCSLFSPWYELVDGTVDGWRSLKLIDIWLLITALLAISIPFITAARDTPAVPLAMTVLTWFAAILAILMVLYRVLSEANAAFVTGRSWGLAVAALGAVGTFAGAHWALRTEDAPGLRPPPEVRAMPAPPVRDPATPPT
jgi:hypothetical protein